MIFSGPRSGCARCIALGAGVNKLVRRAVRRRGFWRRLRRPPPVTHERPESQRQQRENAGYDRGPPRAPAPSEVRSEQRGSKRQRKQDPGKPLRERVAGVRDADDDPGQRERRERSRRRSCRSDRERAMGGLNVLRGIRWRKWQNRSPRATSRLPQDQARRAILHPSLDDPAACQAAGHLSAIRNRGTVPRSGHPNTYLRFLGSFRWHGRCCF